MKKVFKASILAASVVLAFAANAATVSSTPVNLSAQGLKVGLTSNDVLSFDVLVSKDHASSSEITLTFSSKVNLAGVVAAGGGVVTNNPGTGTGTSGDISFNYGTGSFTFDNVVVDAVARTIKFKVNLGNPLTANSSFRVTLADTKAVLSGAATVSYSSALAGTVIETGSGEIAKEVNQFGYSVVKKLDGVIERKNRITFAKNGETAGTDALELKFTNATVAADTIAYADGTVVTLTGDFSDAVTHPTGAWTTAGGTVLRVNDTTFTVTYDGAEYNAAVLAGKDTITFTKGGASVIETSTFKTSVSHKFDSAALLGGTEATESLGSDVDSGKWTLDAAVVNVPYLPINYGLSSNVEVANHGDTAAEIIAEGFDDTGKVYAPKVIKTIAKKTMGKVSENDLKAAFGIDATTKVKLNVTFVIDQDANKVTLVPYYREGESRINVVSDQYKDASVK